jgi:subtilase family serine protease
MMGQQMMWECLCLVFLFQSATVLGFPMKFGYPARKEMERMKQRSTFKQLIRSPSDHVHEVVFALKQNNLDVIEREVLERATPGNTKYQQWMTFDEVGSLIRNDAATQYLTDLLQLDSSINITWQSKRGEYVKAQAPISSWETLLSTQFYEWHDTHNAAYVHRCKTYYLPEEATAHIHAVFHTSQALPVAVKHQRRRTVEDEGAPYPYKTLMTIHDSSRFLRHESRTDSEPVEVAESANVVTISFLDQYYGVHSNEALPSQRMSVFETANQGMSPSDLRQFQRLNGFPHQEPIFVGGLGNVSACTFYRCGEGNLDIQYIMGAAQNAVALYW